MSPTIISMAVVGGGGFIGKRHCQHVQENLQARLCAIVDPGAAGVETARALGVPVYATVAELLQSPDKPDAAIICTPNHTHVPVGVQLVDAGIHVLCEKPIAIDHASGRALVEAARRNKTHLLIGHHRRFNPYMLTLKNVVDSGRLGQIVAVNGLWTTIKPSEYFKGHNAWRSEKGTGGVVLINLIHDVDLMQYLFGPITKVHAEKTQPQRSEGDEAVEEGAAIIFKFKSGLVGTFIVSDNVASPHSFEQGTGENPDLPKTGMDVYRIFGSQGTVSFPDMNLSSFEDGKASWFNDMTSTKLEVEGANLAPLALQLDHFVQVCIGRAEPACSGRDGLRALAVCEAIRNALDIGMADVETI